ncbi:MAG: DUF3531 family protein [Pseudanabaenaceae cyanobacterium]
MEVQFLECDWFNLYITIELLDYPTEQEKQIIEELFNSWFLLGKLGAFNAENTQVQDAGVDINYLEYEVYGTGDLMAVMHNMGEVEYEGKRASCWFDLGTSDAICLDMLLNSLKQLHNDYVGIARVIIGGQGNNSTPES